MRSSINIFPVDIQEKRKERLKYGSDALDGQWIDSMVERYMPVA